MTVAPGTIGRMQRHYDSLRGVGNLPVVGPLLTWVASRAVPRDSRVWMQVSGPAEVLEGAPRSLEKQRPRILCEIHSETSRRLVRSDFAHGDYVCESCDENHILALRK